MASKKKVTQARLDQLHRLWQKKQAAVDKLENRLRAATMSAEAAGRRYDYARDSRNN